jgi:hypothetical protein
MTGSFIANASLMLPAPRLAIKKSARDMKCGISPVNPSTCIGIRVGMARKTSAVRWLRPQSAISWISRIELSSIRTTRAIRGALDAEED